MELDKFPDTICGVLRLLEEEEVIIILESGEKERVKVLAVRGNIVVAKTSSGHIKFINCDCICAVIVDCNDIIDGLFPCPPDRKY